LNGALLSPGESSKTITRGGGETKNPGQEKETLSGEKKIGCGSNMKKGKRDRTAPEKSKKEKL